MASKVKTINVDFVDEDKDNGLVGAAAPTTATGGQDFASFALPEREDETFLRPADEQPVDDTYLRPADEKPACEDFPLPVNYDEQPVDDTFLRPAEEEPVDDTYLRPAEEEPVREDVMVEEKPACEDFPLPVNYDEKPACEDFPLPVNNSDSADYFVFDAPSVAAPPSIDLVGGMGVTLGETYVAAAYTIDSSYGIVVFGGSADDVPNI